MKAPAKYTAETTVFMTEEQRRQLKDLKARTRVPMSELIRQGIDLVLVKYAKAKLG